MRVNERAKINAVYYLLLSVLLRWGYNILFIVMKPFSPMESAILHMVIVLASLAVAWMALQLYRKSGPTGSNLGCGFLVILLLNLVMCFGAVFAALIHIFSANGGEVESLWLM